MPQFSEAVNRTFRKDAGLLMKSEKISGFARKTLAVN